MAGWKRGLNQPSAMLQRVTKFAKKTEVPAPAFASLTAADVIRAPVIQKTIPLDFVSVVAPYKRQGRLSLRVEYVPQRARLSAGRNNGDGSWSLASDELEGLTYLIPDNLAQEHTLLLRIMTLEEAGASTIKVLHFPVSLEAAMPGPAKPVKEDGATARGVDADNPILHNQLEKMHSLFAVRESELAELRAALEQARGEKEADLAQALAGWEQELQRRLLDAVAQARAQWQSEHKTQKAAGDKNIAQAQAEAEQKIAAERGRWQGKTQERIETERARWKAEGADILAKSIANERKLWQAEADQRIEAERQRWKSESVGELSGTLTQERLRWQAEADQRSEAERQRWRIESQGDLSVAIAQESVRWQAETEKRLEAERRRWKAESQGDRSQALAQEGARWQLEAEQQLENERQRWKTQSAAAQAEAEARWKAEEVKRTAAASAEWRDQASRMQSDASEKCRKLEMALAEALARAGTNSPAGETGSGALRDELARMQSILVRRDLELDQHRLALEQEREQRRQELEASLTAAAQAWKADENTRLAAMLEKARAQSDAELDAATARCEAAESALADAKNKETFNRKDDVYVRGLQKELSTLRASLVNREVELGHARAALDRARTRTVQNDVPASQPRRMRTIDDPIEEEPVVNSKRGLVRDFVVAVCVLAPVIFFYPRLEVYLPDEVKTNIAVVTGGLLGSSVEPARQTQAAAPPLQAVVKPKMAIVNHAANVRATAGAKGAIIVTLPRGASVTVLEQHGNWTLIETIVKDAKPQRGFVFSSYLKNKP